VSVHTATNPSASFDRYRTFSFGAPEGPPQGYATSRWSAEARERVEPLIASALTQRGYSDVAARGDLVITFGTGRRTVAIHEGSDVSSDSWIGNDENGSFVERSLSIDAFDAASGVRVWHGSSRAEIDPDHVGQTLLASTVTAMLAAFPVAR
jgi:hypothetical protein